jgi:hypothetical protein
MEEAFTNYLLGASGLTALVGPRITWATRPQASALPSVVLHKITSQPIYSDEGESGLTSARMQIDCWGATYAAAKGVARQVMARLSGGGASFTQSNFEFQASFAEDEQDSFERGAGGEDLYRVRLDFIIWYKEI